MNKKEAKTLEKCLNIISYFDYHNKNLTKQQYLFMQDLKEMLLSLLDTSKVEKEFENEDLISFILETRHILGTIAFDTERTDKLSSKKEIYEMVGRLVEKYKTSDTMLSDLHFLAYLSATLKKGEK